MKVLFKLFLILVGRTTVLWYDRILWYTNLTLREREKGTHDER